jgi:transposase-like protein
MDDLPSKQERSPGDGERSYLSPTAAKVAQDFFQRAVGETDVMPVHVITDTAKCYPPALRAVLPLAKHRTAKYLNNGFERDHGHRKQRLYPMRGFTHAAAADILARGHAFIQNLRTGFSRLTRTVPRALRLMTAWSQLTQAI